MEEKIEPENYEFSIKNLTGELFLNEEKEDSYIFGVAESDTMKVSEEIYKICDASEDEVFEKLFKGETIINGVDGYSRGKALLKSILYYKNGTYVKEIYELKNDFSKNIADKHPFIATLSDNSKIAVAFQLQNYYFNGLDLYYLNSIIISYIRFKFIYIW